MFEDSDLKGLVENIEIFLKHSDLSETRNKLTLLEIEANKPDIWNNPSQASTINRELSLLNSKIKKVESLENRKNDLIAAIELSDHEESTNIYKNLKVDFTTIQNERYLSGKFDTENAQLSIHAGAGGLDAQDWAAMLCSMYQSFATSQKWDWEIIAISSGEEGGIKSVTLDIKGDYAYGFLKEEAGVHRLVRISPFNSGKTRETSFALVEVIPLNLNQYVEIQEIPEKDLKWEYSMSSGKGGQSVNTTYSAVRLVHIPTGISVSCQNERSQLQNKQQALKYLLNKLAALELKKSIELKNEIKGGFVSAEWGSQIRSYVLHPYKLVKDHRSGFETSDITDILDNGNILPIIWSVKTSAV